MSDVAVSVLKGTRVILTTTFTNGDTDAVDDPDTVTVEWRAPGATTTTTWTFGVDSEVVRKSVGVYEIRPIVSTAGTWWWVWRGVGAEVNVAVQAAIRVEDTAL